MTSPQKEVGADQGRARAIDAVLRVRWGDDAQKIRDHGGFYLERAEEIADAVIAAFASPAAGGEVGRLREALTARDKKAGECPDSKLDQAKDCPRCGASASEGCRITAIADAAFVHNARAVLREAATASSTRNTEGTASNAPQ